MSIRELVRRKRPSIGATRASPLYLARRYAARSLIGANNDWAIAATLVVLVLATRLPFRTSMLYNWDSANFALALRQFDVTKHFPHPPGYFYYVHLGKLIDVYLRDANASYVAESVLFSVLAVIALYYLGKAMFDRATGFVAALLLVFSVTFWSYGTVALPYVSLAFFSTVVALLAYRTLFEGRNLLLPLSLAYTIGGGFRPDLLLFLAPLWLSCLRSQRTGRIVASFLVVVGGFLLWFVPTTVLSGGVEQYLVTFAAYTSADVMQKYSVPQNGLAALLVNVRDTLSYMFYGLYSVAAVVAFGFVAGLRRYVTRVASDRDGVGKGRWLTRREAFAASWVAPMALFYVWIHVGDPGYVFTILPALLVLAARSITRIELAGIARGKIIGGITAVVILANIMVYSSHPRLLTLPGIRQTDRSIADKIRYIRESYSPGAVVLISYDLYRHLMYYLPEYDSLWLDVYALGPREKMLHAGVERIVLVDERLGPLAAGAKEIELRYGKVYTLPAGAGKRIVYGSDRVVVE